METLKILLAAALSTLFVGISNAQADARMLSAFSDSYKSELSGNYVMSISQVKTVYKADNYPTNARLGWLMFLAKQYTESVSYYEKAIKLKPYAIEVRFGLIKALDALESWDKIKEQYEVILKIDPMNTTSLYWLGVLLYNRKDYEGAARNFEKIVNLYPMDYGSVIMLAWTRLYQGKTSDAKVLFNHALLLSPNDTSATTGINQIE